MIRIEYVCDICEESTSSGYRIRFGIQDAISLAKLDDDDASEKVICSACAFALKDAIARLSKPTIASSSATE